MVAMDALDELGFHVLEASSAARALALAQAHQSEIAFAMVDLGLPDRPGEELVCELRGLYPTLPIIIASGKGLGAVNLMILKTCARRSSASRAGLQQRKFCVLPKGSSGRPELNLSLDIFLGHFPRATFEQVTS